MNPKRVNGDNTYLLNKDVVMLSKPEWRVFGKAGYEPLCSMETYRTRTVTMRTENERINHAPTLNYVIS